MGMRGRHPSWKKTDLVPCEPNMLASVGLDHQNPMRPSTVSLSLFPAAPSVSNLFSEAVWEKGIFRHSCTCYCLLLSDLTACCVSTIRYKQERNKSNFSSPN